MRGSATRRAARVDCARCDFLPTLPRVEEKLGWRGVVLWAVVFCAHRIVMLWFAFDATYYWEETYRLLMGEALAHHWPWPLLEIQADPYSGGSLVFAALAAPVVTVFGPTLLGLKLIALAWSAVGFIAWTALVDRWFGRWPAFAFATLFVFGPPLFTVYNLVAMGSHAEVVTIAGIQLLIAYRFLYDDTHPNGWLAAWGVAAGLGTWFMYTALIPFAACVLVAVAAGTLPVRRWPTLAVGFLVGATPLIAANILGHANGLAVVARTFGSAGPPTAESASYLQVLRYLVTTGIPLALRFPELDLTLPFEAHGRPLVLGQAYFGLYTLCALALVAGCLVRSGARLRRCAASCPELPLLVLVPLFVAILAASDHIFVVNPRAPFFAFRVLVPFLPAMMAVGAIAIGRLPAWPRAATFVVLGIFAGAGSWATLAWGADQRPRLVADARTTGAEAAGHLLYYKHGPTLAVLHDRIAAMPAELQGAAYRGLGFAMAYHDPETNPVSTLLAELEEIPPAFRSDALDGARLALGPGLAQVTPRPPSPHASALRAALDDRTPEPAP
jgi:hypothetical protein